MAKNNEIIIKLRIDDKGNLKKSSAQVEKLSKAQIKQPSLQINYQNQEINIIELKKA